VPHIDETDYVTSLAATIFLGMQESIAIAKASEFVTSLKCYRPGTARPYHPEASIGRSASENLVIQLCGVEGAATSVLNRSLEDLPLTMIDLTRDVFCECALGRKNKKRQSIRNS
jgi:hypothetical protein